MSTTESTLVAERTDQVRTFLTVEAAADVASVPPSPVRRRLVAGTVAALLLAGGLVAATSIGGPAPSAVAYETVDGWTTIRLVDAEADPEAVVQELVAAGFDAERRDPEVLQSGGGQVFSVIAPFDHPDTFEGPVAGLSFELTPEMMAVMQGSGERPVEESFEEVGVRFGDDGSLSFRVGTDITILVLAEA